MNKELIINFLKLHGIGIFLMLVIIAGYYGLHIENSNLKTDKAKLILQNKQIKEDIVKEKNSDAYKIYLGVKEMIEKGNKIQEYRNEKTQINTIINKEKEEIQKIDLRISEIMNNNLPGNLK